MTYKTLNSAWKKLWPDSIAERGFESSESDDSARIDEVVPMAKSMGVKVEREDVHELLKAKKLN